MASRVDLQEGHETFDTERIIGNMAKVKLANKKRCMVGIPEELGRRVRMECLKRREMMSVVVRLLLENWLSKTQRSTT